MSLLGTEPALHEQAVRQTMFDDLLFSEMRLIAPAMDDMIDDLNRDYGYTDVLVSDVFAALFQSAPLVRERREMVEACLLNHAVAVNLARAPEVASLRGYTQHEKYYSAMGTIELANKVREYLRQAQDEMADAALAAEQARQRAEQAEEESREQGLRVQALREQQDLDESALDDAADALEAAQAALAAAMGDFDGNGPLTEQQAEAQAAVEAAEQALADAQAAVDATQAAAALSEAALQALMERSEAARQAAEAAESEVQEVTNRAERATRGPIAEAVHNAVEEFAQQAAAFRAWGTDPGELERMSFQERAAKARRLKSPRLKEFVKMIGRWKAMRAAQYAKKVAAARDEVYDVTTTGHLPDVLPSQFAKLATEPGKVDFLQRLSERQLFGLKFRGKEKVGQGAIIALVDTSSSMKTADVKGCTREVFGKGMALALLDQARDEKRDFVGILFASASQQKVFRFPKGQGSFDDVLNFAEEFLNGGTDFQRPMNLAMDILDQQFNEEGLPKGDVVLITDDDCRVTPEWLASYQERKAKLDFRTFGIAVGMARPGGTLSTLSDDVRSVQEFSDPSVVADIIRAV